MDNTEIVKAIGEAMWIVSKARASAVTGPTEIWRKLGRIGDYLDNEALVVVRELCAEVTA